MFLRISYNCLYRQNISKYLIFNFKPYSYVELFSLLPRTIHQSTSTCCSEKKKISHCEKGQSWLKLLYNDEHNEDLIKLRRKLDVAVSSTRSKEKGDLLPYLVAQEFVRFYQSQVSLEDKSVLFQKLADKLGIDFNNVSSNINNYDVVLQNERYVYSYLRTLRNSLTPTYKYIFHDISKLEFGTRFLVDMREDLLSCFRKKILSKTPSLQIFDMCLKEHLAIWFANGFLDLEEVSWSKSSGQLLEKIMKFEAVHVIRDWNDLKLRANHGRRIFIFSHRLMPDEPIVILHTLLGNGVPCNIDNVLNTPIREGNLDMITSATFYSVSSTQRGLDGIGLGNLLIKRVVEKLKNEFAHLTTFITLSPIPGFKKWLDLLLISIESSCDLPAQVQGIFDNGKHDFLKLKEYLIIPDWYCNHEALEFMQEPMTRLCAEYLYNTKRRGFACNPVAHFHLRNGACLWKINWLGNTNEYGLTTSYGFMANYKYELTELEKNNNEYVQLGKIAISSDVKKLIDR